MMKSLKHILNRIAFVGMGTLALALPSVAVGDGQSQEYWKCMKKWNPPGAKLDDKNWYNRDIRCETSEKLYKIDEGTCRETLKKLQTQQKKIFAMTDKACRKYVPQILSRGCSVMSRDSQCRHQTRAMFQQAIANSDSIMQDIADLEKGLDVFKNDSLRGANRASRIDQWKERELSKAGGGASRPSYGKDNPGSEKMTLIERKFKDTTGVTTKEYDALKGGGGAPSNDDKIIQRIKERSESDISGTPDSLAQRSKSLDQSWKDLQQVRNPVIHEQLTNHLEAEEMKLALRQYKADTQRMRSELTAMKAKNETALEDLGSLGGVAEHLSANSEAKGSAKGGTPSPSAAGAGGSLDSVTAQAPYSPIVTAGRDATPSNGEKIPEGEKLFSFTFSEVRDYSNPDAREKTVSPDALPVSKGAVSTASRDEVATPADPEKPKKLKASALREALRRKLARGGKATASELAALKDAEAEEAAEEKLAQSDHGADSSSGASRFPASIGGAGSGDDLLGSFGGGLDTGGFSFGGVEAEASARDIVSDFEEALAESQHEPLDYIGNRESSPLFERVKHYHDRCLRSGCVSLRIK